MDYFAADYARQSSARDSGSEASTATQHAENRHALARYNPKTITEFEDLDRSAFKDDVVRKDFERMISLCRAGRINLIAVMYMSRLTRRDPKESLPLLLELLRIGVVIVSANEGEFRHDDENSVITLISLIMRLDQAHKESANKSKHVSAAKRLAKQLGGYLGGTGPYGFDLVFEMRTNPADGKPIQVQVPVHNAIEAEVIREMCRRIKRHMGDEIQRGKHHPGSLSGICVDFNDAEIQTRGQRTGKKRANSKWLPGTMKRILIDPRIAGMAAEPIYGVRADGVPTRKIVGYTVLRDPETTEPLPWGEPIIDPADWWQLQPWLNGRGQGRGQARAITCLSGLRTPDGRSILTCECGKPMNSLNNNITPTERNPYGAMPSYRCTRPRGGEFPGEHSGGNTIIQTYLDTYLAERIFALISTAEGDPETGDVLRTAARRHQEAQEAPESIGERQALLAERADAAQTLRDIADAFGKAKSAIMRSSLIDQESIAADRLSAAERRLADLDQAKAQPLPIQEWLSSEISSDPMAEGTWWAQTSVNERRDWFALFLDNVTVTKSTKRGGHRWVTYDTRSRVEITWAHEHDDFDDSGTAEG